jgi:hypothetical protein
MPALVLESSCSNHSVILAARSLNSKHICCALAALWFDGYFVHIFFSECLHTAQSIFLRTERDTVKNVIDFPVPSHITNRLVKMRELYARRAPPKIESAARSSSYNVISSASTVRYTYSKNWCLEKNSSSLYLLWVDEI